MSVQTATVRAPTTAPPGDRLALAIIVSCQLMLVVDATVMNVALPHIRADLGFSPTGLSWVMNAYTLAFGGLLLLGGRAGDIFGRRRLFMGGIALFTLASLAGGLATDARWLIAARILQGVGAAAAGPSTIALLTTTFTEPRRRIRALALLSAMASAGFAIGLVVGGLLTQAGSWRWVLFINVPFGVAALVLAPRHVREPERHPGRLEASGAVTATGGVAALVYGAIRAATHGWSDPASLATLTAGAALIGGFVAIQARSRQPLMPLRLFADRNRVVAYACCLLGPAAMMSMFYFLTQFLQSVRGYGPVATGFAFLPMAAGIFAMTRVVPVLLPRTGPKPLALIGAPLLLAGLLWLTRLNAESGYVSGLLGPMALVGLGGGFLFVPLTPVIMSTVAPADAGAAGGALQTMQQVGATLGLAVLVAVFGATVDGRPGTEAFVHGMSTAFTVSAGIIGAAFVVVAVGFRGRGRGGRPDGGRRQLGANGHSS